MAKKGNKKNNKGKNGFGKQLNDFAYKMGLVNKGLKSESQVRDSYNRGCNYSAKAKKPLY